MKAFKMEKHLIIRLFLVFLLLLFVYLGYAFGKNSFPFGPENWQVVQLSSGEFYYGKLQTFPSWQLKDVYILRQFQQATSTQTKLIPLSEIIYEPENAIKLNRDQVLWWADLEEKGEILEVLKGK